MQLIIVSVRFKIFAVYLFFYYLFKLKDELKSWQGL